MEQRNLDLLYLLIIRQDVNLIGFDYLIYAYVHSQFLDFVSFIYLLGRWLWINEHSIVPA